MVTGIAGWFMVRWLIRWSEREDLDSQVAWIVDGWDADAELADLVAQEPTWSGRLGVPVSDEHLLLIADITGVRR